MRKRILQLTLSGAVCMIIAVGGTAFVSAEHGPGGSSSTGSGTSGGDNGTDLVHGTSGTSGSNGSGDTGTSGSDSETEHGTETSGSDNTSGDSESHSGRQLSGGRLRVCENRQHVINNITSRIVTRSTKQLNLFTTIAQRVEAFKTSHNLTVADYDQLVAGLQADQAKTTNDLTTMKSNQTLECAGDPQGVASAFQTALKQEISDLKTYKTDVKNLITTVKAAAGNSNSTGQNTTRGNQ